MKNEFFVRDTRGRHSICPYEVISTSYNSKDSLDVEYTVHFKGTLADCYAWIELKSQGMI